MLFQESTSWVGSPFWTSCFSILIKGKVFYLEKTLFNIAIILVCTKICGNISKKISMPEVLGFLFSGVIIGPAMLNMVHLDGSVRLLSTLGVILLMFLAGLETDVNQLKKASKSSSVIALFGILLPLILGTSAAFLFSDNTTENIFIGIVLTATSVSITVETLNEINKLKTTAGVNILGAAVIDDFVGLILISGFLSTQTNSSNNSLLYTIVRSLSFCLIFGLLIFSIPKLTSKYAKYLKPDHTLLAFCITAVLSLSFVAESFGISAIVGAYLCGLMFSQLEHKKYIETNIKSISASFLSPIFFASIGLEVVLSGLSSKMILIAGVMFVIAVIGKVLGCGFAARLLKISKQESTQIGIGMISRGEVAIITANLGLHSNIIKYELFVIIVLVVLLTTIVTPVLLKLSFKENYEARICLSFLNIFLGKNKK